jgi:hypothetical protein
VDTVYATQTESSRRQKLSPVRKLVPFMNAGEASLRAF